MQLDMNKVAEKLAIQLANSALENAKLVALAEQQQQEITQLKAEKEEGNQHEN